ncbi:MAG TPA: hypothetical protein VE988_01930 [Gemmataceae bacterium]|nr:hypothetical protein [Gemmataceae bacterium]
MAKTKNHENGRLEDAIATLIQNQASFLARMSAMDERYARMDERFAHIDDRFARIEAILLEHNRLMLALPEAVRDKIGFRAPEKPAPGGRQG